MLLLRKCFIIGLSMLPAQTDNLHACKMGVKRVVGIDWEVSLSLLESGVP